jgi:hypothetical protein
MHSLSIASAVLRGLFRFDVVMKTLAGALLAGFLSQAAHAARSSSSGRAPTAQTLNPSAKWTFPLLRPIGPSRSPMYPA